jgi:glycosyltransferase involved in cell wall biosynthesis
MKRRLVLVTIKSNTITKTNNSAKQTNNSAKQIKDSAKQTNSSAKQANNSAKQTNNSAKRPLKRNFVIQTKKRPIIKRKIHKHNKTNSTSAKRKFIIREPRSLETTRPGINYFGFVRSEMGIGEACRGMAKALQTTSVPFGLINFHAAAREQDLSWKHKETKSTPYKINVFHMNPDSFMTAPERFDPKFFVDRFNIGYWAWEAMEFPKDWRKAFPWFQEIWVPSTFTMDAISQVSPVPVVRIPHCIEFNQPDPGQRSKFGLPEDPFLFLTMFDTHSLSIRKNPEGVIEAFKRAFHPGDQTVGLVIKINNPETFPEETVRLQQLIGNYRNIHVINRILTREEVYALIDSTDCYVSLHRSEGFGLVLAEAMYLKKPVIGTNWSGNTDFMNPSNSGSVKYFLTEVGTDIGPYRSNYIWAEPDINDAALNMQRMFEDAAWRNEIAEKGRQTILSDFSAKAVGYKIRKRLERRGLI